MRGAVPARVHGPRAVGLERRRGRARPWLRCANALGGVFARRRAGLRVCGQALARRPRRLDGCASRYRHAAPWVRRWRATARVMVALARREQQRPRGGGRAAAPREGRGPAHVSGGQADACFQVGVLFYYGRESFPRDRTRASTSFARGCDLGDARACNNVGDALAYGDGVGRDVESAAAAFLKACRLGEALGCANLGYMAEYGEGVARDVARARTLYRQACRAGDAWGCLHVDLLAAEDAGAPREPTSALAHWRSACEQGPERARVRVRRRHVRGRSERSGPRRGQEPAGDGARLRSRRESRLRLGLESHSED